MAFNDSAFRVKNTGDSTYYRPSREAADRAACECLRIGDRSCQGVIEENTSRGWEVVARYQYGKGIMAANA